MTQSRALIRTLNLCILLSLFTGTAAMAQCTSGTTATQFHCWEQQITSSVDFYAGGAGNPYRDLVLRVTFTGGGSSFTQDAFWVGDTLNPKAFKVRAALPPGTWSWSIAGCTGTTHGQNCATATTWSPNSGTLTVGTTSAGPLLFTKGFPLQTTFLIKTLPPTTAYSPLVYGDKVTPFYWAADSAWSAPGFEASTQTSYWSTYIADRASRSMNVVLVAPAATYAAFPTNKGPFKPDVNTCTGPVPNDCSMPNPTYWTNFDNLINAANQSGIVPLIAGLIDPLDTATSGTYPDQRNAVAFSRFLAARMSGFAVFYSPGFDDMVSGVTAEGTNLGQVMNAVGSAVKQAAPNYLVTNHLNGRATCSDYQTFRASGWMTFFAFQSSHGIGLPANTPTNTPDPAGTICPRAMDTSETPVQASLRRTWQMPWILTTSTATPHLPSYSPILPAYNVEGPYDNVCLQTAGCTCPTGSPPWCHAYDLNSGGSFGANYVDIRYHIRQAAYESMLSGAYGFTYGVQELGHWYFIQTPFATALQAPAVADIKSVFMNFNSRAGMTPHREWITNNGLDTADDGNKKSALASDGSSLVLAYLPAGGVSTIAISTTGLPGLTCPGSGWTYSWRHAEDNVLFTGGTTCSGSNPIQVTRPDFNNSSACTGYDPQACDWILQIQKTGSPFAQAVASPIGPTLDVWADLSSKDGTSAIHASLLPLGGVQAVSVAISSEGISFQQSPRWTPLVNNYLTVWQAEGWDGSMLGIFGQVLDHNAQCLGGRFQINTTTDQDQQDPAVDSDLLGNAAVVWSSLGQDGDLGGIWAPF